MRAASLTVVVSCVLLVVHSTAVVYTGGSALSTDGSSLGAHMIHTLPKNVKQPLTAAAAEAAGWKTTNDTCVPSLGIAYAPKGGITRQSPLSAYFTPAGQLCGLKITVYGTGGHFGHSAFEGQAALGNMVSQGFYIPVSSAENTFEMSVSFRSPADVCATASLPAAIGDRVVINAHTALKYSLPMTAGQAASAGFQAGSCMSGMGQHFFRDLESGSTMSWITGNLMPITPMYYPAGDPSGKLNGIFLSSPACQYDNGPAWDNVPVECALTSNLMCENFCNEKCSTGLLSDSPWQKPHKTERYATFHIMFQNQAGWDSVKCPGASDNPFQSGGVAAVAAGRTCPRNTPSAQAQAHMAQGPRAPEQQSGSSV
eukprot:g3184.t1